MTVADEVVVLNIALGVSYAATVLIVAALALTDEVSEKIRPILWVVRRLVAWAAIGGGLYILLVVPLRKSQLPVSPANLLMSADTTIGLFLILVGILFIVFYLLEFIWELSKLAGIIGECIGFFIVMEAVLAVLAAPFANGTRLIVCNVAPWIASQDPYCSWPLLPWWQIAFGGSALPPSSFSLAEYPARISTLFGVILGIFDLSGGHLTFDRILHAGVVLGEIGGGIAVVEKLRRILSRAGEKKEEPGEPETESHKPEKQAPAQSKAGRSKPKKEALAPPKSTRSKPNDAAVIQPATKRGKSKREEPVRTKTGAGKPNKQGQVQPKAKHPVRKPKGKGERRGKKSPRRQRLPA